LPGIPEHFPVPIVIVQHMPPLFTRLLAERLNKQCAIEIHEGTEGAVWKPGEAWIAPGGFHMTVTRTDGVTKLALQQEAPENSCRPGVDMLFRSVARLYGVSTLAVVLTGMGSDGVKGSQAIREFGGQVIVQDEATSVVWGMPGQVAGAGLAEEIFPLRGMAQGIDRRVETRELLNEITIGETCLFRSQPQLNALHNVILPEIVAERLKIGLKKLKIWSAGCSTGEEPYTLAMFLQEEKASLLKDWNFEIHATDLNDRSIETARAGIYGDYALRNTSESFKRKYFSPVDGGKLRVRDEMRAHITFSRLNLNDDQLNLSQQENGLAGADMAAVATNFAQAQIASQATINATAKVLSLPTLLDYLK
jgi:hypothetical protein